MHRKNMWVGLIVVLILVGAALIFVKQKADAKEYSVVYLSTGEVYIGHLTAFPDMELNGGYILITVKDTTDPTKSSFQLNPLSEALWAPKVLHLNRKNVVFYGPILPSSKIAQVLAAKK